MTINWKDLLIGLTFASLLAVIAIGLLIRVFMPWKVQTVEDLLGAPHRIQENQ